MSDRLDLVVDRESEVPLGTQLIWKLRILIATGALAPDARLPGIREVAEEAGVNVNTVRAVFARLEEQGLLVTEQGRGTFVAAGATSDPELARAAEEAIAQAREAGVDPRALAAALYVTTGTDRPVHRRTLYAEIERLEGELGALDPLTSLRPRAEEPTPRILTVQQLVEVRDELLRRIEDLRDEREQARAQAAALEAQEAEQQRRRDQGAARWRNAGVWTGASRAEVSWTMP